MVIGSRLFEIYQKTFDTFSFRPHCKWGGGVSVILDLSHIRMRSIIILVTHCFNILEKATNSNSDILITIAAHLQWTKNVTMYSPHAFWHHFNWF